MLDGGTGRELLRIGAPFGQPEWSARALLEAPQFVTRVHQSFVAAGADVITTNSYAVVPFHLGQERFESQGHALAALSGRLARAVADDAPRPVRVAACLPPLCGSYQFERYDAAAARPILTTLIDALEVSADFWLAETLSTQVEAELVRIGAGTTHAAIEDGAVPGRIGQIMAAVARGIAYRPVRNRGTIGGSLVHADPAADWVAVLPALGAAAVAIGPRGERRIAVAGFVTGIFETALAADELLRAIELPVLPAAARWGHWKFCRNVGEFSKATACVLAVPGEVPRAVLAALDGPPLVIEDASALVKDPVSEAVRIVSRFRELTAWRRSVAETALRRAVEMAGRA